MVKEKIIQKSKSYMCEECGMAYRNKEKAGECEEWCKKHKSCNLKIIKYAMPLNKK